MTRRPERDIQKAIVQYLRLKGILAFRMNSGASIQYYKGRSRLIRYGVPGMADIVAFPQWKPVHWIEVKRDKGKLSPDQQHFALIVGAEGHKYIVARSIEDLQREGL